MPARRHRHLALCKAVGLAGLAAALVVIGSAGAGPIAVSRGTDGCIQCHTFDTGFSHPVGVVPSMAIPVDFPLESAVIGGTDAAPRIGCSTCHDVAVGRHEIPLANHGLRGRRRGAELCAACHDPVSADPVALHAGFVGRAHLGHGPGAEADSDGCLACHDGSVAADAGPFAGPAMSLGRFTDGHPVGVAYDTGRGRGMVPSSILDERIRLFGGRVECGSCHSLYAPTDQHLVVPNDGSRLCLSCHRP